MPMNTLNQAFIEVTAAQAKAIGELAKLRRGKLRIEETNYGPAGTVSVATNHESLFWFVMPNGRIVSLESGVVVDAGGEEDSD
jgi:hypothetical protein